MTLIELVSEIARMGGDSGMERVTSDQILNYINTEIKKLTAMFPQAIQAEFTSTATGFYHTLDSSLPDMEVTEVLVDGRGANKKMWKYMKGATGDAV